MRNILLVGLFVFLVVLVAAAQDKSQSKEQEKGPVPVPTMSEKAVRYYRSGVVLWVVDTALGILIPAIFLFTGFSARIRTWAQRWGVNGFSSLRFTLSYSRS